MQSILPLEERPDEPEAPRWQALGASGLLHALLLLWLIFRPAAAGTTEPRPEESGQAAQPIALPRPQENPTTLPPRQPVKAQPPPRESPLGPDSKRPDAKVPQEAGPVKPLTEPDPTPTKAPNDPAPSVEQPPDPSPKEPTPQAVKRIPLAKDYAASGRLAGTPTSPWGPPTASPLDAGKSAGVAAPAAAAAVGSMGRVGQTGRDARDWRPSFPEAAGRCVSIPDLGTNADGTPVLATVIGRVLDTDGRTPMVGAHLQIMGTQFATFSGPNGEYRLEFDPKLLEQCRVQYVRVVADGYSGQLLTLAIGERVRSDDVVLRKH
ncbi:MAG: hypothetical protein ABJC19_05180 [Gemmatimonadota bacterium]